MSFYQYLLRIQGIFYFLTGIWPQFDIQSFMRVTGPKTDIWLVKTVGLMIVACSIGMFLASFRKRVQPDVIIIGLGFALFLTGIDIYYALSDVIRNIYLADAVAEILLVLAWSCWWYREKSGNKVQKNLKN